MPNCIGKIIPVKENAVITNYRQIVKQEEAKPCLPDTNAADMARCVNRLRAHLKPKHLLTWWIFANMIGAGIYLAQLASMHLGGAQ